MNSEHKLEYEGVSRKDVISKFLLFLFVVALLYVILILPDRIKIFKYYNQVESRFIVGDYENVINSVKKLDDLSDLSSLSIVYLNVSILFSADSESTIFKIALDYLKNFDKKSTEFVKVTDHLSEDDCIFLISLLSN